MEFNRDSFLFKMVFIILKIAKVGFFVAACYHFIAIFIRLNDAPVWRNILFVLINMLCAIEIQKGKSYFIFLFSILFIQQLISHGGSLIKSCNTNQTDWLSIFVLISITAIYASLLISKRESIDSKK
jgi:hypothetical protein